MVTDARSTTLARDGREESGPVAAVEGSILDGLGKVGHGQALRSVEVGDSPRHLEDAVVGAGGESLLLHGTLEQPLGVGAELAVGADLTRGHLRIRVDLLAILAEAFALALARGENSFADLGGAFGGGAPAQFLVLNGGNLNVNVDAVEQRAGDLGDVALDHRRGAHAFARFVVEVSAGASLRCLFAISHFVRRD